MGSNPKNSPDHYAHTHTDGQNDLHVPCYFSSQQMNDYGQSYQNLLVILFHWQELMAGADLKEMHIIRFFFFVWAALKSLSLIVYVVN